MLAGLVLLLAHTETEYVAVSAILIVELKNSPLFDVMLLASISNLLGLTVKYVERCNVAVLLFPEISCAVVNGASLTPVLCG